MAIARYESIHYQSNMGSGEPKGPAPKNVAITPPWTNEVSFRMSVARHPEILEPFFVGSAIRCNSFLLELARRLTSNERDKANKKVASEARKILDGGGTRRGETTILGSDGIPTYKAYVGEQNDPKGLYFYYRIGTFLKHPAMHIMAIAKTKDSQRVDELLKMGKPKIVRR